MSKAGKLAPETNWASTSPGDEVLLTVNDRLESITSDREFSLGRWSTVPEVLYCLCIGRVASTTVSGLTLLKVYLLTPSGVGYKRINLGGDRRQKLYIF